MPKILYLSMLLFWMHSTFASHLTGHIINEQKEPIPFVNIYIQSLSSGTTTNIDGAFHLNIDSGEYVLTIRAIGYQTLRHPLNVAGENKHLEFVLKKQNYSLPEFKVLASGEDPAYYIMRKAIAMAPYYKEQISEYECKVYLKGTGIYKKIPGLFKKQLKKSGIDKNEPIVSETLSKVYFKLPDETKQDVIAMRSSGQSNNTSPMPFITNNLYNADKYDMISPTDPKALSVYTFQLDGSYLDQGRTINRIKVIPKRKGQDLFSGYIHITDQFWNIHSAELSIDIPMAQVQMRQVYGHVDKDIWMPVGLDFNIDLKAMGFHINFKYVATMSEYKTVLNPHINHSWIAQQQKLLDQRHTTESELMNRLAAEEISTSKQKTKIDELLSKEDLSNRETRKLNRLMEKENKAARPPESLEIKKIVQSTYKDINNDSAYWADIRPVPLTMSEATSYQGKDSILALQSDPAYMDSLRNSKRKFKVRHLLNGKRYDYSIDSINQNTYFSFPGLINLTGFSFNTVDGLRLNLPFYFVHQDSTGRRWQVAPNVAYASLRKHIDADLDLLYRLDGMTNTVLHLSGGVRTLDFNQSSGISRLINTDYSLFYRENYPKYYQNTFGSVGIKRELINGLQAKFSFTYQQREHLKNHSNYSFMFKNEKNYTNNIPQNENAALWQFENHTSKELNLKLEYTPHHRYYLRNNVKVHVPSKYPLLKLNYTMAFGDETKNQASFHYVEGSINQSISMGLMDEFRYHISAGAFINNDKVYFADFKHFDTDNLNLSDRTSDAQFSTLPFYYYSSNECFMQAHARYENYRFIIKRLPLLSNTNISESLSSHYLYTPSLGHYAEFSYGIHNIYLMGHFQITAGIGSKLPWSVNWKMTFDL